MEYAWLYTKREIEEMKKSIELTRDSKMKKQKEEILKGYQVENEMFNRLMNK